MRWWLVVVDGNRNWVRHERGQRGLTAPNTGRPAHAAVRDVRPGDLVLMYVTYQSGPPELSSSLAAVAMVTSPGIHRDPGPIEADLTAAEVLPVPVKIHQMKRARGLSEPVDRLLRMNMQAYLTPLTTNDIPLLIGAENVEWLRKRYPRATVPHG